MPFPPNINPQLLSITAVAIGAVLVDNYNANELNVIGNWLQLVGQYIETCSAQLSLIQARTTSSNANTSQNQNQDQDDHNVSSNTSTEDNACNQNQDETALILEMIERMRVEIEKLKTNQNWEE